MKPNMYFFKIELLLIFLTLTASLSVAQEFTNLEGDYLGQPLPKDTPVVFAPGLVSSPELEHSAAMFSPNGNEVFWHVNLPPKNDKEKWTSVTKTMRRINNRWTEPDTTNMKHPFYSVDGQRLYFLGEPRSPYYADKQNGEWGKWHKIDLLDRFPEIQMVYINSVTKDGTLYFTGKSEGIGTMHDQVIYRSEFKNGKYEKPELLPSNINKPPYLNWIPYIAPDESYMIFSSSRNAIENDIGDLYITFRESDKSWTEPVNMGAPVNTPQQERLAHLTPDGKYLFFTRWTPDNNQDVFWVSANIIEKHKEAYKQKTFKP